MPFFAAAVVTAAAYGSGLALTLGGRIPIVDGLRRRLTVFSIGFAALSLLALALGLLHAFRPHVLAPIAIGGVLLVLPFVPAEVRAAQAAWRDCGPARWLLLAAAAMVAVDVVLAVAPPTSGDALAYHLAAPKEWLAAGRTFPIWWSWGSFQPFSVEMHFAYAQALWSGAAGSVVGALLGGFSAACVYGLTRAVVGPTAAAVAALLWVGQGMFLWEATGAFVELVLAGFVALAAWHLVELRRSGRLTDAAWAGLAIGLAAGTKYHGLVFAPLFLGLAALFAPRGRRRAAAGVLALLSLVALPWYLRNWVVAGNPFYPFLSTVFGGRYMDDAARADFSQSLNGYAMPGIWRLPLFPLEFVLHRDRYERGWAFSPALLLLAPAALVVGGRTARLLAAGIVAYLLVWWEAMNQATRYLLPVFPFAALLAAWAAVALWEGRAGRRYVLAVGGMTAAALLAITGVVAWGTLPGALGLRSTATYVQKQTGTYDAFRWLDRNLPPDGRVLVGIRDLYWLERPHAAFDLPVFNFGEPAAVEIARARRYDVRYLAFLDGALPSQFAPLRPHLRELARLDVPFVTSRALGRVEHHTLVVWKWCREPGATCAGGSG